jgi:hypothetical protein
MFIVISVFFVLVCAIAAYFFLIKKDENKEASTENDSEGAPAQVSPFERRASSIIALSLQARETGVAHQTDIESLIDDIVVLHEKMSNLTDDRVQLMMSAPSDLQRMLEQHLPEYISRYALLDLSSKESKDSFNSTLSQLKGVVNAMIDDIEKENFSSFSQKNKFMEIRFSDKY